MNNLQDSTQCLVLLSHLLLGRDSAGNLNDGESGPYRDHSARAIAQALPGMDRQKSGELCSLATANHVLVRGLTRLRHWPGPTGFALDWIEPVLAAEHSRVRHALSFLAPICRELERAGEVVVIKSLDHWPDFGSDIDLYTNAESADVVAIMQDRFQAKVQDRSWGDRLANKWNFSLPGLPELVEVHVARLGQTGEQVEITESLIERSRRIQFESYTFRVPAPEHRLLISTLQRMYRHFYMRLCDIVDNAVLVERAGVDYEYLESLAQPAGLWHGLATYVVIVSEYVESYRGTPLPLPALVTRAARFGNERVSYKRNFLRIPIFPHSAKLYASEWTRLLLRGEIQSTLRLSLLPGLATAAALGAKLTGSDKGIW